MLLHLPTHESTVYVLTDVAVPARPLPVAEALPLALVELAVPGAVRQAGHERRVPGLAPPAHPAQVAVAPRVGPALTVPAAAGVRTVLWKKRQNMYAFS